MSEQPTVAQQLAEYVTSMTLEALSADVVEKTKQIVLDTVGCMIRGSRDRAGAAAVGDAVRRGTRARSTVFGRAELVDPEHAALANGTLAHVLELDDGHRPSDNHLGGVVVPAAVAVAQDSDSSGKELLLAVTLGYDVMGRVGEAVMLPRIRSSFHHTGTTGVFGSAAATGRLVGLDVTKLVNAFGIAGDGAAALKEFQTPPFTGMDCKPLHSGRAAQIGITAAFLAAEGFEGSTTIFEGPKGFARVFSPQPRPELICRELGERFAVMESGFKSHACPGGALAVAADAALWLRKEHRIDPGSITRITIGIPNWTKDPGFERLRHHHPSTVGQARFSYVFIVAAALADGIVTYDQLSERKLVDPLIVRLQDNTEFVDDAEVQEISDKLTREDPYYFAPARVVVEAGGRTYSRLERTAYGYDPTRALTREEVIRKFRHMVDGLLNERQADATIEWAFDLDSGSDASSLARVLA